MKAKEFFKKSWVYLLCGAVAVSSIFIGITKISGTSMTDTYQNNQIVLVNKTNKTPQVGDVITCKVPSGKTYIKRVIATGGDVVNIDYDTGEVYVNGEKLIEDYIKDGVTKMPVYTGTEEDTVVVDDESHKIYVNGELIYESIKFPFTVSENCYFVMGDNRLGSYDSREKSIGEIPQENIIGTVINGHKDITYESSTNVTKKDD
jgi:signal peptidase I